MSVINECSCCLEQTYLFDHIGIKHMGVDERGTKENNTISVQTQTSVRMEERTCV